MQATILGAAATTGAPAATQARWPSPWRAWVGRLGAAALGAVLLFATVAKALDPQAFADLLREQGLTLALPPMTAALLLLGVEGALGLLLLLGVRRRWSMGVATLLVVAFVALNGRDWWRAAHGVLPEAACGCFGNLVQRSPAEAFWQDLTLLLPLLLLGWLGLPRAAPALPPRRLALAAAGVAGLLLFAWRAPALPLDDFATRLRPGVELSRLCAGEPHPVCLTDAVPELAAGRTWVVLVDLEDAAQWVAALDRFAATADNPPVVALTTAGSDQVAAFGWQWGPTFPLREVPAALIRPLHRRLPRSFLSEDGRVVRTAPGLPPAGDVRGDHAR